MLTKQQQFKVAFLHACIDRGLTLGETHEVVKQALWGLNDAASAAKTVLDAAKGLGSTAATGLLLGSVALGGAGGYLAGRGSGINDEDVKEVKRQELISAYRAARENLLQKQRVRQDKQQRRSAPARSLV